MSIDKNEILYGLWRLPSSQLDDELYNYCLNMTEHFFSLIASNNTNYLSHYSLNRLFGHARRNGKKWCVVFTPGTTFKRTFFREIEKTIESSAENVGLMAHLIDRKQRGVGIHEQFFIVNISIWCEAGCPSLGFPSEKMKIGQGFERSEDNIHDDYTPLWIKQKKSKGEIEYDLPRVIGWRLIDQLVSVNSLVVNIPHSLREAKNFLYPDQNSHELKYIFENLNGNIKDQYNKLSSHQRKMVDEIIYEARGYDRKMFLFNTEGFEDINATKEKKPLDIVFCVASGSKDLFLLKHFGFSSDSRIIYFDINQSALNYKKIFWEEWDGENYLDFVSRSYQKAVQQNPEETICAFNQEDLERQWHKECDLWGDVEEFAKTFISFKNNIKEYERIDIIQDQDRLLNIIKNKSKGKNVAVWYSNVFNYTPVLASMGWNIDEVKKSGENLLRQLMKMAQGNDYNISIFGEDVQLGVASIADSARIESRFG